MKTPMGELPHEAVIFSGFMCQRYMMCMEVMLSAYCVYAQIIEGLPCDDDLYRVTPRIRDEWDEAQRDWIRVVTNGKLFVKRRPVGEVGEAS
jgi:hypothetical protein